MATNQQLILSADLANIKFNSEGLLTNRKHFARVFVDDTKVKKSTDTKPRSSVFTLEWNGDKQIWFNPSSKIRGMAIDLLENYESLELKDKKGDPVQLKMTMALSRVSGSEGDSTKFMEKVDADVSRLDNNRRISSAISMLAPILQVTKKVMDNLSQSKHHGPFSRVSMRQYKTWISRMNLSEGWPPSYMNCLAVQVQFRICQLSPTQ
ncbi:hypothetical protein CPB84DRAFT_1470437 [Gymnopilus junonius]|uniref:Uncharacterized protein n=1 Tax=Gymnopilus junonius TaxID=109634 RepID=A0A9P5NHE4_GYMJU|nr:hypothetical protein CPB84DRAFT_1470437 [Gymnopilus junonius]